MYKFIETFNKYCGTEINENQGKMPLNQERTISACDVFIKNNSNPIYRIDLEGKLIESNQAFASIFECSSKVQDELFYKLLPKETHLQAFHYFNLAVRGTKQDFLTKYLLKNGKFLLTKTILIPIYKGIEVTSIIGIVKNVSKHASFRVG